jgi:hypothetical protein
MKFFLHGTKGQLVFGFPGAHDRPRLLDRPLLRETRERKKGCFLSQPARNPSSDSTRAAAAHQEVARPMAASNSCSSNGFARCAAKPAANERAMSS